MDEDQLFLRPTKPPLAGIGEDACPHRRRLVFIRPLSR
jgi:hypothetical protein